MISTQWWRKANVEGLQRFLGEYGHLDWNMGGVDMEAVECWQGAVRAEWDLQHFTTMFRNGNWPASTAHPILTSNEEASSSIHLCPVTKVYAVFSQCCAIEVS